MQTDDTRFVSDGLDLGQWLWELVAGEMERRDRAAAWLLRQSLEPPEMWTEGFDLARYQQEFEEAVQQAAGAAEFDTRGYIEALADFMVAAQAERMRLAREENARTDRVTDRILARLEQDPTPEAMAKLAPRLRRVFCWSCDERNVLAQAQIRLGTQEIAAWVVFKALGSHLLLVPERLLRMLRDKDERSKALAALEALGPGAGMFAEELLAQLDAGREGYGFDGAKALAAVVREDAGRVREVVARLDAKKRSVVEGALYTLTFLGERAAERVPECVAKLAALTGHPDLTCRLAAIDALGSVTRGTDVAVDLLLSLSREAEMAVRGSAIAALGNVGRQPEKVVPRLIEALEDYQEYDPDWRHASEHGRVVEALQAFGPAAAPAVPALIARIRRPGDDIDQGVIKTLRVLRPAARDALPALERLAGEMEYDTGDFEDPLDELALAIRELRALPGNVGR